AHAAAQASQPAAATAALTDPASGANCAGQDVRVARDGFELVVEGDCGKVVVTGSRGAINVDRAAAIRVEGSHVTVLNAQAGEIIVTGHDNTLNLTNAGALAIEGDRNLVLARELGPVAISGRDNTVNPDNAPALDDSGTGNRLL
ncbi:DUF3060 domain-containing protein, partial [Luteimonas sp. SDU101]|uniref:DUF3060 domain-containing protein n=1 Tax=Luteimonas sp. SDU101 TaxID=3422593 RepID=UPI003EBB9A01